jgi:hypothetical protein
MKKGRISRNWRASCVSAQLANGLSSSLTRGHNGNDLDLLKFLSPRDFKQQERSVNQKGWFHLVVSDAEIS